MYNRLEHFFNQSHIISENQLGFRKKHSTPMALIKRIDKITKGIDNNAYSISVFVDLSKATARTVEQRDSYVTSGAGKQARNKILPILNILKNLKRANGFRGSRCVCDSHYWPN